MTLSHCPVVGGAVDLDHCSSEPIVAATTKGGEPIAPRAHTMRLELGGIIGPERHDSYTENLAGFSYSEQALSPSAGLEAHALVDVAPRVWLGLLASSVAMPSWSHGVTGSDLEEKLDWNTTTTLAVARGVLGEGRFTAYGEVGAGIGMGRTALHAADSMTYTDTSFGPAFALGLGLHLDVWNKIGVASGYELDYAPVVKDLIGNTHASGGHRWTLSLTFDL
jgi:opacity protein-like surface antigen